MNKKLRIGDIVIIGMALVLCMALVFVQMKQKAGEYVYVTNKGDKKQYQLNENRVIELKDIKVHNVIVIKDGEVYMEEADCPDQICVHHKSISKNGESIICLPNEVYIEVASSQDKEIDN